MIELAEFDSETVLLMALSGFSIGYLRQLEAHNLKHFICPSSAVDARLPDIPSQFGPAAPGPSQPWTRPSRPTEPSSATHPYPLLQAGWGLDHVLNYPARGPLERRFRSTISSLLVYALPRLSLERPHIAVPSGLGSIQEI